MLNVRKLNRKSLTARHVKGQFDGALYKYLFAFKHYIRNRTRMLADILFIVIDFFYSLKPPLTYLATMIRFSSNHPKQLTYFFSSELKF